MDYKMLFPLIGTHFVVYVDGTLILFSFGNPGSYFGYAFQS